MNDHLTDVERFVAMTMEYGEIYQNDTAFAKKIGSGKQTVNNWSNRKGDTIQTRNQIKICEAFNLQHTVWSDEFYDEINFKQSLHAYQKVSKPISIEEEQKKKLDNKIIGKGKKLTADEEDMLSKLASESSLELSSIEVGDKSPIFLFELSKIFKEKNQIVEALEIINILLNSNSTFRYTYNNEIEHLKAVLLSHGQIQRWDEAIDTLRLLYSASHYHLVEPEIITLMASNYKRKALTSRSGDGWRDRGDVDIDLLASAFSLYSDAYKLKSIEHRYYDAVNIAYLANIINAIEHSEEESLSISSLYSELSFEWRADEDKWWEVSSDAEMLMLSGNIEIAISKLNDFFDFNQDIDKFDIGTTLRQLEMYLHFVDDGSALVFYEYLKESWGHIKS